jgi:undecaprenyl-diphosphatase
MGVVEGVTEFLPVSSTGHLILAGHALQFTDARADIFEVVIQAGAMLAVLGMYGKRIAGFLKPGPSTGLNGMRGLFLLGITSAPALVLGLVAHKAIKAVLFKPFPVALALLVGGVAMLVLESVKRPVTTPTIDELTWQKALGVGCCQCLALWPGMSRSASTIVGGMMLGMSRPAAAEYSFLAALPIIGAATLYDVYKGIKGDLLHASDLPLFAVGLVVSAVAAWVAIKVFIRFVASNTLRGFGVYRVLLAAVVLLFPAAFGG